MKNFIELPTELQGEISLALLNSGVTGECQQCHRGRMKIQPGATIKILQNQYPKVLQLGRCVVCAITTCDHCGHVEEYDLNTLGLMEKFQPFFDKVGKEDA